MHKLLKKVETALDNKWVMGGITVLLFAHMIATPWMPTTYLAGFSSLAARIVISVLVLCLVCVHPYYGILLTSILVVALNEYTNRSAAFQNTAEEIVAVPTMGELDAIYHAPLHNPKQYDQNFPLAAAPQNISADSDTVLVPEFNDVRKLINQHSMQTTSVVGGLHGIFNQSEEQKMDAMIRTHLASSTLTQNVEHSYVGSVSYLTEQNLADAQTNLVGGVDMNSVVSNFPEIGNKQMLDLQGLSTHFPGGVDPSATNACKF